VTARVLSYPPAHDYVDRLHPESARLVHRDEPWPRLDRFYDPAWLEAHRAEWDVAHLHFTWEQHGLTRFAGVLRAHGAADTPLVWTVHDLSNPHTRDHDEDGAYLGFLAERADLVLTLTPGAANEVRGRFGREVRVVAHGPLLDSLAARRWRAQRAQAVRRRRPGEPARLLLHAKSLRANLDWRTPVEVVGRMAVAGARVRLDVLVHDGTPGLAEVRAAAGPGVAVIPHHPLPFSALCRRIAETDALLLPYAWGTHSGLLELATDLGVPVVAGDVGYLREQAPLLPVPVRDGLLDADSLERALVAVSEGAVPEPVPRSRRKRDLDEFRAAHREVYAGLLEG
jgi:glycosyltransferase involved in cell wall biosynthesis